MATNMTEKVRLSQTTVQTWQTEQRHPSEAILIPCLPPALRLILPLPTSVQN
jgi:hypothetical protein